MTTDLEKQFYTTFGIETEERFYCKKGYCNQNPSVKENSLECRECENGVYYIFPEITHRILLNLILIMNPYAPPVGNTMEEMKEQVLFWCIEFADELKHQVQELFKEK